MSFLKTKNNKEVRKYSDYLVAVGAFSNLYSSSNKPYIQYRVAENVFCKAFDAENLARADSAYDAYIGGFGIGIKTFVLSGKSKIEKVAEFNSYSPELRLLRGIELAKRLAYYRNERIEFADRIYDIKNRIYHIIGRDKGTIKIFEVIYELIDIPSIKIIQETKSSLRFKDRNNEYNFNYSKSVLMMRFNVPDNCLVLEIDIIEDPISLLVSLSGQKSSAIVDMPFTDKLKVASAKLKQIISQTHDAPSEDIQLGFAYTDELIAGKDYVILPLYSHNAKENGREPIVPLKSQLNQWNAGGRKRDPGEVYIPIPAEIHNIAPEFFPEKDYVFKLKVPNGDILNAKVCQDGSKALMTNPNNALADWLLRKVLRLEEKEILTYEHLRKVGYDSVKITKVEKDEFLIDFAPLDTYENFILKNYE
ncbi:restriction endonuclease [bacterium]|nr:MAG: restriction endonuclease [bacterium]